MVLCITFHSSFWYYVTLQDGHPPLGWNDTAAYLVLPVLLVVSQYVSMELMKPPEVRTSAFLLSVIHCLPIYFKMTIAERHSSTDWSSSEEFTSHPQVPSSHDRLFFIIRPIRIIHILVSLRILLSILIFVFSVFSISCICKDSRAVSALYQFVFMWLILHWQHCHSIMHK